MRESICVVVTLVEVPKDDGRLARRTARRLGVRLLIPRIRLTRFDEPPASHDETEDNGALIEIGPDTPPPQPRGVDEQVGVRLQGRQEPLRPLRQRGIAGCEIGSPPGLAGGREIYVGFFGSSSGLSLRERWHLRCEELFGPLPQPLSPAFPAHLEQMFNLRISGSENLDINVENIPLPPGTPPAANWFRVEEIPLPAEVEACEVVEPAVEEPVPVIEEPEDEEVVEPLALYVAVPSGDLVLRLVRVWPCENGPPPPPPPSPVDVPDVRVPSPMLPAIEMPAQPGQEEVRPPTPPPRLMASPPPPPPPSPEHPVTPPHAPVPLAVVSPVRRQVVRPFGRNGLCGEGCGQFADLPDESIRCFRCLRHGHLSYHCPNPPAEGLQCFNCYEEGHVRRHCPYPLRYRIRPQDELARGLRRQFVDPHGVVRHQREWQNLLQGDGQLQSGPEVAPGMEQAAAAPTAPGPQVPSASGSNGRGRGSNGRGRAQVPQARLPPPANVSSSSEEELWDWYVNFYFIPKIMHDRNSSGKDPNYFEPHASSNNPFSSVPIVRGP
ncbi:hypothetical protein V9T40_006951 [Parthenolecanium corni]|uniref:CCHC-type domain-containing protein n=1 Tax=Parthenolecanium corni TaxID=536013 RepID=A0AAN9U4G4_9HEMI